tara:strand:- start:483 stop:812 length:330 start_codon:yes stop_codon:yes gene_type:complete
MSFLAQSPVASSSSLLDYGIAGGVILALFGLLLHVLKEHKGERKAWQEEASTRARAHEKCLTVSNQVQKELTVAVVELTTQSRQSAALQMTMREEQIRAAAAAAAANPH